MAVEVAGWLNWCAPTRVGSPEAEDPDNFDGDGRRLADYLNAGQQLGRLHQLNPVPKRIGDVAAIIAGEGLILDNLKAFIFQTLD